MTVIRNYILSYIGPPVCPNPFRASSAQIHPAPICSNPSRAPFRSNLPRPLSIQISVPFSAQMSTPLLPKHILARIPQGYHAAAPLPAAPLPAAVRTRCRHSSATTQVSSSGHCSLSFSSHHSPNSVRLSASL
jgi:hypothetical protein